MAVATNNRYLAINRPRALRRRANGTNWAAVSMMRANTII